MSVLSNMQDVARKQVQRWAERMDATSLKGFSLGGDTMAALDDVETRRIMYRIWAAYYNNTVYDSISRGGFRMLINDYLGESRVGDLTGLINPIKRVCDAYQLVFHGRFGDEIKIDDFLDDGETEVKEPTREAIHKIWRWSDIDAEVKLMMRWTPMLGTSGLRITARNSTDEKRKRVYMSIEHPSRVLDVDRDARGNLEQILLEHRRMEGNIAPKEVLNVPARVGEADDIRREHVYLEYMSKTEFWMKRDNEWWDFANNRVVLTKAEATYPNKLGIVPYILIQDENYGGNFGLPCFAGNERKVDHINALANHVNQQIHRHVTVTWFLETGGEPPKYLELGDQSLVVVQRTFGQQSGGGSSTLKAMVADLDLAGSIAQLETMMGELGNSMPELKATDGEFLSHQSGGTVAQLRTPAELKLLSARANFEQSLIKAQKIALSLGILYGMWDLGTGMKSLEAADRAYHEGFEEHRFNTRAIMPLTVDDKLTLAKTEATLDPPDNGGAPAGSPGGGSTNGGDNTGVVAKPSQRARAGRNERKKAQRAATQGAAGSTGA